MKLESKYLAGYLPYELRIKNKTTDMPLTGAYLDELNDPLFGFDDTFKPILHPLSDLTKEIEVNGKKFVPIEVLNNMLFTKHSKLEYYDSEFCNGAILFSTNIKGFNILSMNEKIQKLYEWHFDIYGLIENGLAIDINTLDK